jgi:hypothetical protein
MNGSAISGGFAKAATRMRDRSDAVQRKRAHRMKKKYCSTSLADVTAQVC